MKSSRTNARQLLCCRNLALTALLVLGLSAALAYAGGPKNRLKVRGSAVFCFTPPVNITPLTGDLEGILYGYDDPAVTCEDKVGDDGTIPFCVKHRWDITDKGTFFTRGDGLLFPTKTPGLYKFSEWQTFLPDGTGDFAGTLSGWLVLQGIVDFNACDGAGGGSFDYRGVILVEEEEEEHEDDEQEDDDEDDD